jgi:hypothetical protein
MSRIWCGDDDGKPYSHSHYRKWLAARDRPSLANRG